MNCKECKEKNFKDWVYCSYGGMELPTKHKYGPYTYERSGC